MSMVTVLANIAAPKIVSLTGNIFIVLAIIPIECLVIWLLFRYAFKIRLGIPRILIVTLIANIITSIIGVPFLFNSSFGGSPGTAIFFLPFLFFFTWLIEELLYLPLLRLRSKKKRIRKRQVILAVFLSNLASYSFFLFILLPITLNSPGQVLSQTNPERAEWEMRMLIPNVKRGQMAFYQKNSRFATNFKELSDSNGMDTTMSKTPGEADNQIEDKFNTFTISGDDKKGILKVAAKEEVLYSYTAVVFASDEEGEFIQGICKSEKPTKVAPEIPQIKDNKIQCLPGSSVLEGMFF